MRTVQQSSLKPRITIQRNMVKTDVKIMLALWSYEITYDDYCDSARPEVLALRARLSYTGRWDSDQLLACITTEIKSAMFRGRFNIRRNTATI